MIAGCLGDESEDSADNGSDSNESDTDAASDEEENATETNDASNPNGSGETSDSAGNESGSGGGSLELLAEAGIDHEHACLHAEFDERKPLEAGSAEDSPTTVEETHVMWEVAIEGESGYISFDVASHEHDGPFVFYTAGGAATPVVGSEGERDAVPEDACTDLEEYVQVSPEDGQLTIEVTAE